MPEKPFLTKGFSESTMPSSRAYSLKTVLKYNPKENRKTRKPKVMGSDQRFFLSTAGDKPDWAWSFFFNALLIMECKYVKSVGIGKEKMKII